ncbi:MAG: hypothetical protein IT328_04615 [Caldilineaceae bacterium]|nr:hypothetical protein [Caldilineaceae bacterium]
MMEPTILKVSGGWINASAIRYAETAPGPALIVGVEGKAQPIMLKGADAQRVAAYLNSRTWQMPEAEAEPKTEVIVE